MDGRAGARVPWEIGGLFWVFRGLFWLIFRVSWDLEFGCILLFSVSSWVLVRNSSKFPPAALLGVRLSEFSQLHFNGGRWRGAGCGLGKWFFMMGMAIVFWLSPVGPGLRFEVELGGFLDVRGYLFEGQAFGLAAF